MVAPVGELLEGQRALFRTGATIDVSTRIAALELLREGIQSREADITRALRSDLGKGAQESYMCEVGLVLGEISYQLRNIRRLTRRRLKPTPLAHQLAVSYEQASPLGNVLIISPWNYPFLLTIEPLVDALAAGNTAIVKPSAYSPATSALMAELLGELFPPEYVAVVLGGREENQALLDEKFDLVFFTGSQAVGKVVLEKSARHLTPAILELGGKSPCIVDFSAKVEAAARRIVWGKFLNCGQTCVAPDYIVCDERIRDELLAQLERQVRVQYGDDPLANESYGRIVNEKHFDRLTGLIGTGTVGFGGRSDRSTLRIEPTVLVDVDWDDPVMQDEIFGPILPVISCTNILDALETIEARPKPLAFYLFSQDNDAIRAITSKCRFGGGCVNDTVCHLATSHMRFGGVGESGMGGYHGEAGFAAFSHYKSVMRKASWFDMPMRYQPFDKVGDVLVHLLLR